jgi:threonine/homoserine/homoserine lactone efflux protein
MSNASRYGFRKSITFNYGVFIGFFIILGLCNLFSYTLFSLLPSIKPIMTYIGAGYILYLAWKTYHSNNTQTEKKNDKNTATFLSGFLLQFVNPKTILYGITTFSTFVVPYYSSPAVLGLFTFTLAFMGFISTLCWSLFGSVFQRFLSNYEKVINTIMALLLVYCAISLFM